MKRFSSPDDLAWLRDIQESFEKIIAWTTSADVNEFMARGQLYSAVIREFTVVGEAVKRLSSELVESTPDVPWRELAGFRDVLVHNYFGVRDEVVWDAATNTVPSLVRAIAQLLGSAP